MNKDLVMLPISIGRIASPFSSSKHGFLATSPFCKEAIRWLTISAQILCLAPTDMQRRFAQSQ